MKSDLEKIIKKLNKEIQGESVYARIASDNLFKGRVEGLEKALEIVREVYFEKKEKKS